MADEKTVSEKLDAFFDSFNKRMDSADEERKADRARLDAYGSRMDSLDEERKTDKARKDSEEEKARKDAAEQEEKTKADAAKKDADEKEEKAKADKVRADAEEKVRSDAANAIPPAVAAALADIQRNLPAILTPENRKLFTDVQFKAERVYQAFADGAAPPPLRGEALPDYQRRLLSKYKAHSPRWKEKDLTKVDASVLDIAEEHIYADAMHAAAHPVDLPAGTLREIPRTDHSGRNIFEFVGDERAAWEPFRNGGFRGRFVRPSQH